MTEKSFVYLILDEDSNAVKIGKANDVHQRLSDLQTGNPNFLKVISVIECESSKHAEELESELHDVYKDLRKRKNGEWFYYDKEAFKELITNGIDFTPKKTREPLVVIRNTLFGEEELFNSEKAPNCYFYPFLKAQTLDRYENLVNRKMKWRTMEYPTNGKQKLRPFCDSDETDRVFISDRKHKENLAKAQHDRKKSTQLHLDNQKLITINDFTG